MSVLLFTAGGSFGFVVLAKTQYQKEVAFSTSLLLCRYRSYPSVLHLSLELGKRRSSEEGSGATTGG